MAEEEEEEEEEEWQSPHLQSLSSPSFSSSSHTLSPIRTATHLRRNDLSIFPPINHEGLLIPPPPPPPRAPLCLSSSDSDSYSQPPSPSPKPPPSHFAKWVDFALHLWNSKLQSFLTHVRSLRLVSSIRLVGSIVPFLAVLWLWALWRRRRRCGGGGQESESVDQLKLLIKEKDEGNN
ncbi:hypothetical protein Cgig2_006111 [Carnegiea gigantea]|uniref:Uncharacterized protein n=1 Tax=Carnegiea gigantea TaxID=171969 RepID=A0A9Q1KWT4_9CARY|nr:hypothetical protein Cgig2_006111 [Carnegiea gigantea]